MNESLAFAIIVARELFPLILGFIIFAVFILFILYKLGIKAGTSGLVLAILGLSTIGLISMAFSGSSDAEFRSFDNFCLEYLFLLA